MQPATKRNLSIRERAKNLKEQQTAQQNDLEGLRTELSNTQDVMGKIVESINSKLGSVPERLSNLEELIGAALDLLNVEDDAITTKVKENRQKLAKVNYEATQKVIEEAVNNGDLLVADSIQEDVMAFILEKNQNGDVAERDAGGNLVYAGHVQIEVSKLKSELKELLLGKVVGDVLTMPNGSTIQVESIYRANPERLQKTMQDAVENVSQSETEV